MNYDIISVMISQDTVDLVFTKRWATECLDSFFSFLFFFNLTAVMSRLATRQLISESPPRHPRLVFIIRRGFSACYKRLISQHPGCQGCLNFPKLSPTAFLSAPAKKAITKIAAFFFSCVCLPLLFLFAVPLCAFFWWLRGRMKSAVLTRNRSLFLTTVSFAAFFPVSAPSFLMLVGRSRYAVVLLLSHFFCFFANTFTLKMQKTVNSTLSGCCTKYL